MQMRWATVSCFFTRFKCRSDLITEVASRIVQSKLLRLVGLLATLFLCPQPLKAQESQTVRVALKASIADLIEWTETSNQTKLNVEIQDVSDSASTKSITFALEPRHYFGESVKYVNAPVSIREKQGSWLDIGHFERGYVALLIPSVSWLKGSETIHVEPYSSGHELVLRLELDRGDYKVSATILADRGPIANSSTVCGTYEPCELFITTSSFDRFRQKLFTAEKLLGIATLGLLTILIGVLKESIKNGLNKFLDFLGKHLGGKLAERRFLRRYLDNLAFNHRYLKLVGFNTAGISRPLLEDVFVSLRIASNVAKVSSNKDGGQDDPTISFNTAFKQYRRMVILGAPGAGKTTTLSYALLAFSQAKAAHKMGIEEQLLPIYIPLRRLSSSRRSIIEDVVDKDTQILSPEILKEYPALYFERKLKKGQCLLLLDGLDEVLDEKTHREIAERINSLVAAYPRNRFIVTCRTAGWKDLLSGEFKVLAAQDFNREEIRRFVLGWHKAVITQSEHARLHLEIPDKKKFEEAWEIRKRESVGPAIDVQSRSLIHAIDRNNRILAIAVNPMLLSLISLVHFNRKFLPRGRTVLYGQCIDLLIDSWDRSRDILSPRASVTAAQKEAVLREIAFNFQVRGKGEDSRENLEHLISTITLRLGISSPTNEFLEDIEKRSGLLVERSLDVFGFSHLTLQEYLVARHIQLNQHHHHLLLANIDNQAWREVIQLHTGLVDDATDLIRHVASSVSLERQILAGYCVGDAQHCDGKISSEIVEILISHLGKRDDKVDELINVLASIAADFSYEPRSVEEQLSARLIETATIDFSRGYRLSAIAILGRGRVTKALASLIHLLSDEREEIRNETIKAIVLFGDLALPDIERSIEEGLRQTTIRRPHYLRSVASALSQINTGSAARTLLRLYDLSSGEFDIIISSELSKMMSNPLVEADLLELETTQLPVGLKHLTIDRNGWSYKSAHSGFWLLDSKLRRDILSFLEDGDPDLRLQLIEPKNFSFKVMFPTLLSYLRSLPKLAPTQGTSTNSLQSFLDQGRLGYFGFEDAEPNKIKYLVNELRAKAAIPLDLALQRAYGSQNADYTKRTTLIRRIIVSIALAYFMLFYLGVLYSSSDAPTVLRTLIIQADPSLLPFWYLNVFALLMITLPVFFYLTLIILTKRKMQKGFLSFQFGLLVFSPIPRFMTLLPFIGKYRPVIKLLMFQLLTLALSPFGHIGVVVVVIKWFFPEITLGYDSFHVFYMVSPALFLPLSFAFWRYQVIAQNPVFELIRMHPRGRELIV